jgi:hypothetical protein
MLFSNLALSRKDANESLDNHRHFVSGIRGQFKSACPFNDGLNEFEIPVAVVVENCVSKPTAEALKPIQILATLNELATKTSNSKGRGKRSSVGFPLNPGNTLRSDGKNVHRAPNPSFPGC